MGKNNSTNSWLFTPSPQMLRIAQNASNKRKSDYSQVYPLKTPKKLVLPVKNPFSTTGTKTKTKKKKKTQLNMSTGVYVGNFKKGKKPKANIFTQALRTGFKEDVEHYGRVEDPDCVWVGHSTKDEQGYANCINGIILRKLFKTAGYEINNRNEELGLTTSTNSAGFRIVYIVQDPVTSVQFIYDTQDTFDGQNFLSLVSSSGISDHIAEYIRDLVDTEPFRVILYQFDQGATGTYRMAAQLNLIDHLITFMAKSTLVVQNRTSGANATAEDATIGAADRVDNQPLNGKMYTFSQASPRLGSSQNTGSATTTSEKFHFVPTVGVQLIRCAEVDLGFQSSVDPKTFSNCSKVSNILLQPGNIKQNVIMHKYEGKLNTVLSRMKSRARFEESAFSGGSGSFSYIQLGEKLRTVSDNRVTVQYERKLEVGGFLRKTKPVAFTPTFATLQINNLPA